MIMKNLWDCDDTEPDITWTVWHHAVTKQGTHSDHVWADFYITRPVNFYILSLSLSS